MNFSETDVVPVNKRDVNRHNIDIRAQTCPSMCRCSDVLRLNIVPAKIDSSPTRHSVTRADLMPFNHVNRIPITPLTPSFSNRTGVDDVAPAMARRGWDLIGSPVMDREFALLIGVNSCPQNQITEWS